MCTARTRSGRRSSATRNASRAPSCRVATGTSATCRRGGRVSNVASLFERGDVHHHDAPLEEQTGLEPQRVVVAQHVTQPWLLDRSPARRPRSRWSANSARSLCTSARAVLHQPALRRDELELAAVARPERGAEVAVLGPDVHRPHAVGVEVVDVAHRPVERRRRPATRARPTARRLAVATASAGVGLVELRRHVVVVPVDPHEHRDGDRDDRS